MPDKKNLPKTNDHKAPAVKDRKFSTEFHGVKIEVERERLDDWRFTEALYDVQSGTDFTKSVKIMRMILGDSYGPVVDALESESDGHLSNQAMAEACQELMEDLAPNS